MNVDEKWEAVRSYYEENYHFKFKKRPSNEKIEFLYGEMNKLNTCLKEYKEKHVTQLSRLLKLEIGKRIHH